MTQYHRCKKWNTCPTKNYMMDNGKNPQFKIQQIEKSGWYSNSGGPEPKHPGEPKNSEIYKKINKH